MALLWFLIAMSGGYQGPLKKAFSHLPPPKVVKMDSEEILVPRPPLPVENEASVFESPVWFYQEDPGSQKNQKENNQISTVNTDFQGIYNTGWYPPDVQLAVGNTYVGEVVNANIAFYTKSGSQVYYTSLYNFFSPLNPSNNFIFDPKMAYDPIDNRWIVVALQLNDNINESNYYLAVSQTSDPLGGWYYYSLDATLDGSNPSNNWADYPGLGFNNWGIFITSNQFTWSGNWSYAKLRVLDKQAAYNGTLSGWYDFWNVNFSSSWKAAQCVSSCDTGYVLRSYWGGSSYLRGWRITGTPSSPSLSPRYDIPVQYYAPPPEAQQQGGSYGLDAGDARIQDVTYKDGLLYATLGEENPNNSSYCSARYFKINAGNFSVLEDISFGASGYNYIYPRVAASNSDVAMVFTRCGPSEYAGVHYTIKGINDPSFQPSVLIKAGEDYYEVVDSYGRNRWGDYFGGYLDPTGQTIWLCGEYASTNNRWGTWIAEVSLNVGDTTPPTVPNLVYPPDGSALSNSTVTFIWNSSQDTGSGVDKYQLAYADNPSFAGATVVDVFDTTYQVVLTDTTYYWHVRAVDSTGNQSNWSGVWSFVLDTQAPSPPILISPVGGNYQNYSTVLFIWSHVTRLGKPHGNSVSSSTIYYIKEVATDRYFNNLVSVDTTIDTAKIAIMTQGFYYWRVRAYDAAGNQGTYSAPDSFGVDLSNPTVPNLVSPMDSAILSNSSINFVWNSSSDNGSGVDHYLLEYSDNPSFLGASQVDVYDTTYNLTLPDTNYYWHVKSFDKAGNESGWSYAWTFILDTGAPAAPILLSPVGGSYQSSTTVTFEWSAVTLSPSSRIGKGTNDIDATPVHYIIEVATDPGFATMIFVDTTDNTMLTTTFSDGFYYWHVRAYDDAGNQGAFSLPDSFGIDVVPPGTPTPLLPVDGAYVSDQTPQFVWSSATDNQSGVYRYDIEYADNPSFSGSTLVQVTDTTYIPVNDLSQGVWYWRVRAVDYALNPGNFSSVFSFEIDVDNPVAPTLILPLDGEVTGVRPTLVWGTVTLFASQGWHKGSAGSLNAPVTYRLEISEDSSFSSGNFVYTGLTDTSFAVPDTLFPTDTTLQLYWRVRGEDEAGNIGPYSDVWYFVYDKLPPVIESTTYYNDTIVDVRTLAVTSKVKDLWGLDHVEVIYNVNNTGWIVDTMTAIDSLWYLGEIILPDTGYHFSIDYFVLATDLSDPPNSAMDPPTGVFSFNVTIPQFVRGDVNADNNVNVSDAVFILNNLFPTPSFLCQRSADCNLDSTLTVSDVGYLLNHLFPYPSLPAPDTCGWSPYDTLPCGSFPACGWSLVVSGIPAKKSLGTVKVELGDVKRDGPNWERPVYLVNEVDVAAFELKFRDLDVGKMRLNFDGLVTEDFDFLTTYYDEGRAMVAAVVSLTPSEDGVAKGFLSPGRHEILRIEGFGKGDVIVEEAVFTDIYGMTIASDRSEKKEVNRESPKSFGILSIYPNPFSDQVTLELSLPKNTFSEVSIYTASGQRVKRLLYGVQESNRVKLVWNGRDDRGRPLPEGIYFVKFSAQGHGEVKRIALLK